MKSGCVFRERKNQQWIICVREAVDRRCRPAGVGSLLFASRPLYSSLKQLVKDEQAVCDSPWNLLTWVYGQSSHRPIRACLLNHTWVPKTACYELNLKVPSHRYTQRVNSVMPSTVHNVDKSLNVCRCDNNLILLSKLKCEHTRIRVWANSKNIDCL